MRTLLRPIVRLLVSSDLRPAEILLVKAIAAGLAAYVGVEIA